MPEQGKPQGNRKALVIGPQMVDTLSKSQRERAEKLVKAMRYSLHNSEKYLTDYLDGRVHAAKLYGVFVQTCDQMQDCVSEILKMHQNKG